jgi:uncharacterized protein YbjT (DUF2867 family)
MNIALTGSTGFVGSHILTDLGAHGHEVTEVVRTEAHAEAVQRGGARPAVVDLYDRPALAKPTERAAAAYRDSFLAHPATPPPI